MNRQPCDLHKTYNSGCPACKLKHHGVTVPAAKVGEVLVVPVEADHVEDIPVPEVVEDIVFFHTLTDPPVEVPVEQTLIPNITEEPAADVPLTDPTSTEETVRVDDFDDDEAEDII